MRSSEERDECIDILLQRVKTLEAEVARLKGEPLPQVALAAQQDSGQHQSQAFAFPKLRLKSGTAMSTDSSLESAIGTRWIGRIGVVAIIFGVAFFLKYSFDNKLIGETGRVMLGIFWGAVFIGAGEYLQKKKNMALYGQMLSGAGLAVLYLALYAAVALYHLIPIPLAAAGMLAVTSTGMTLAIRYSAYSLAAIALLGGFLTPIMLSTGQNQPLTLFGYILLLDVGALLLLRFRHWPSLITASLFGTILLYTGWHIEFFDDAQRWLAFGVIVVFFVFYNIYILLSCLYSNRGESNAQYLVIVGSAAFFLLAFFAQQQWDDSWPVKTFALVLAGLEIGLAAIVRSRASSSRMTSDTYAAVSVILTVIATFVALEQRWLLPALTAEMAAFGAIGLRLDYPALRRGAYMLSIVVLFRFSDDIVFWQEPFERYIPVLNSRFLTCASAVAGFYVLMIFINHYKDKLVALERYALVIFFVLSQALSLSLMSVEVYDFFRFRSPGQGLQWGSSHYAYQLSLSVLWAFYASLLVGLGIMKRIREARVLGILILGVTVLKVFFVDLSALQTFYRIISFIVLGLLLLAVSYGYNRFKHLIFGGEHQ